MPARSGEADLVVLAALTLATAFVLAAAVLGVALALRAPAEVVLAVLATGISATGAMTFSLPGVGSDVQSQLPSNRAQALPVPAFG